MSDNILQKAAELDQRRQEQVENQKESINRLLDRVNEMQARIDAAFSVYHETVAAGNNSEDMDRMARDLQGYV